MISFTNTDISSQSLEPVCVWEDAAVWAHWSHSFDRHLNYLRPVSCSSPSKSSPCPGLLRPSSVQKLPCVYWLFLPQSHLDAPATSQTYQDKIKLLSIPTLSLVPALPLQDQKSKCHLLFSFAFHFQFSSHFLLTIPPTSLSSLSPCSCPSSWPMWLP